MQALSAKQELIQWFESEQKKGLSDIKFFPGETSMSSIEKFCEGVLKIIDSKNQGRCELIASYKTR